VDDDESIRESLPYLLKEFGYAAPAFSSAEEFLGSEYLDQTDCLIVDVANARHDWSRAANRIDDS
jgi:FixJ family two-component response regulator